MTETRRPASEIINLTHWMRRYFPDHDPWWTSYKLNAAVIWFGRHVENKLTERDKKGNRLYTLEGVLSHRATDTVIPPDEEATFREWMKTAKGFD